MSALCAQLLAMKRANTIATTTKMLLKALNYV